MNCQAIDLKAYSFGEGTADERRSAEAHLASCAECRDELARLELLTAALGGLRDEEPPHRIAFVSDKILEPSWWQRFWASGPKLGFASALALSAAIVAHGVATRPVVVSEPKPVSTVQSAANTQAQIDEAVTKAVAALRTEMEQRQSAKVDQLLAATEKKYELDRQALAAFADENRLLRMQNSSLRVMTAGLTKRSDTQ